MATQVKTTIEYNDKVITLSSDAFFNRDITGDNRGDYYMAYGQDDEGMEYKITWEIKDQYLGDNGFLTNNDVEEDDFCDWENYEVEML